MRKLITQNVEKKNKIFGFTHSLPNSLTNKFNWSRPITTTQQVSNKVIKSSSSDPLVEYH